MLTYNATQQGIIASSFKIATWLFDVENYYIDYNNQPSGDKYSVSSTITGDVTGHTAIIEAIKRASATAGRLYISSPSGVFQNGEALDSGSNTADADGVRQGSSYNWSTKTWTAAGYDSYTLKIIKDTFSSVPLQNNLTELGMYNPNSLSFSIENKGNSLTASSFFNARVTLSLVISDGTDTETICVWRYVTHQANPAYQQIDFECEDFVASKMGGEYPTLPVVDDLFSPYTSDGIVSTKDAFCVPVVFGTAYIPLQSIPYSDYLRGYVLGDDQGTFTVTEITSPREFNALQSWSSAAFRVVTQTDRFTPSRDWSILHPFLLKKYETDYAGTHTAADHGTICTDSTKSWTNSELLGLRVLNTTDGSSGYITANDATTFTVSLSGGIDDSWDTSDEYELENSGLWVDGDNYLKPLVKYSNSLTSSTTSPADVIEEILKDINVASVNIDTAGSFATADSTYTTWTLAFNGGFYQKKPVQAVLSNILSQCHSVIDVTDKVELRTLSATSQKTLTSADIIAGTFSYDYIIPSEYDSGYIRYQEADKPQDIMLRAIVPAKVASDYPSSEELIVNLVQDTQDAQRLGILHFQRLYGKEAAVGFTAKATTLGLQPGDVITINDTDYGGNYDIVVDSITINSNLTIGFACTKYKYALDDYTDLSPSAISPTTDSMDDFWSVIQVGPTSVTATSGSPVNSLPGNLLIGDNSNYILINPTLKRIVSSNYVSGNFGTGFILDEDLLEVGNIACRGIFRTAVFQKDVLSVVGGSVAVLPGDVLDVAMTALDASTLTIEGNETFVVGDILRMKDDTYDEWLEVSGVGSAPTYSVTRDRGGSYGANSNPPWPKGTSVVNYQQSGDGGIMMTASETNAPYMSIFTHAGAPWSTTTTQVRVGNLNGSYGIAADKYGLAAGDSALADHYILINATDGTIALKGSITITGGTGAVNLSDYSAGPADLDALSDGSTYGRVLLTHITAGAITLSQADGDLDDIADGTYGKVLNASLTAGGLVLVSALSGDLDDLADGTYGKVLNASLTAGGLVLTSALSGTVGASTIITAGTITVTQMGTGSVDYDEIATDAVRAAEIQAGAVAVSEIGSGAVKTDEIYADTILAGDIATGAVRSTEIYGGTIVTGDIAATTILAGNIAANTISTGQIASQGVASDEIKALTIIAGDVAANTLTVSEIGSGAVRTDEIYVNTILAGDIAASAVEASEIKSGNVYSDEIAATTIVAGDIYGNTISTGQIAASGVDTSELAALSVYTGEVFTNTLLAGNIASGAVDTDELAADCITAVELDAGCITADSVGTNQIIATAANFANLVVTDAKIANLTLSTGKVVANAITYAVSDYTGTAVDPSTSPTLASCNIPSATGAGVMINVSFSYTATYGEGDDQTFSFTLVYGTTTIYTLSTLVAPASKAFFSFICKHTPASGNRTYYAKAAGSNDVSIAHRGMSVIEVKK